jgi:hypothetical protein
MFEVNFDREDQITPVKKFYGKYPGWVVDNKPPEDGPHRGELLVKVPGILEETADGEDNKPIEVMATPCFPPGFFFIPRVDDKVWVEFAAGDINQPIWTGVWYPSEATPQTVNEKQPTEDQKIIRTASGHVVQLDDTAGEEKIVITHKGGATIQIDKDGSVMMMNQENSLLYMNAPDGQVMLLEGQHGHTVSLSEEGITIINEKGSTVMLAGEMVRITAKTVALEGESIALGGAGANEPVVLGQTFAGLYSTHTHPHPFGPTGPPIPAPMLGSPDKGGLGLSTVVMVKS